jgi:hypothetical protein
MPETLYKGLKEEMRGLKDPGNVLIAVYILLILLLLLFAGLQSARADFAKAKEGTFSITEGRKGEKNIPELNPNSSIGHLEVSNMRTFLTNTRFS